MKYFPTNYDFLASRAYFETSALHQKVPIIDLL